MSVETHSFHFKAILAFFCVLFCLPAWAGISYSLEQSSASAGETVQISAVMFNETDSTLDWIPPENLVLQWRSPTGEVTRSLAYLDTPAGQRNVPVNAFVRASWKAVVPS